MTDEKIIVQLTKPERKYVRTYHDFLDNSFLTTEEQMIFIVLKSYIDFHEDSGEAYPSMETICKRAKMSEKRARKNIKALIKKGLVKKIQRGFTKTNFYTLADYSTIWDCNNVEDIIAIADNRGTEPLTPAEHIAELEKMGYKIEIKEKEPGTTAPTKVTVEPSTQQSNIFTQSNNTTFFSKSQSLERYTLDQIKEIFEYDALVHDYSYFSQEINAVMELLHDILNTTKGTIRINKEDKPAMTVIGKLMKLGKESIAYSIKKFQEQTDRIKNPRSYMLAILYNAPEQYILDVTNQVQHDMHN